MGFAIFFENCCMFRPTMPVPHTHTNIVATIIACGHNGQSMWHGADCPHRHNCWRVFGLFRCLVHAGPSLAWGPSTKIELHGQRHHVIFFPLPRKWWLCKLRKTWWGHLQVLPVWRGRPHPCWCSWLGSSWLLAQLPYREAALAANLITPEKFLVLH